MDAEDIIKICDQIQKWFKLFPDHGVKGCCCVFCESHDKLLEAQNAIDSCLKRDAEAEREGT